MSTGGSIQMRLGSAGGPAANIESHQLMAAKTASTISGPSIFDALTYGEFCQWNFFIV